MSTGVLESTLKDACFAEPGKIRRPVVQRAMLAGRNVVVHQEDEIRHHGRLSVHGNLPVWHSGAATPDARMTT